jgi:TonB family protein
MTLPATKTKQAPAPVTRRTIARKDAAKSQTASSGEVRSAIVQLQRRQGDRELVQQRATKAQQEAAARRVATLRERLTQAAAPASTTEMATSMQRIRLQWYQERIRERIIAAWILPLPRGDTHDLQATALMRVGRDGQVEHLQLVRPSGNPLFDESLLGAIKHAAPWPELPADYAGEFLEVEMHFSARDT